jgi:uncharacterized protein YfaS (alpha-2-macroglobulin family)
VPPEALTLGALVVIEIRIQAPPGADSPRGERTVRVLSPHPAGLAVEALAPARALRGDLVPIRAAVEPDQVAAVFALPAAGGSYRYLARAVARGAFAWPAGAVEDLEGPRTGSVIAIMPGARVSVR